MPKLAYVKNIVDARKPFCVIEYTRLRMLNIFLNIVGRDIFVW